MDEIEQGKQKFLEVVKGVDSQVQVVIPVTPSNSMFLISLTKGVNRKFITVPEDDIKWALPRLGHVHLKDQRGGKGVADFPPLGEGDVDLESILRDLRSIDFAGPVSMEIEFTNYEWPAWEECVEAAMRGKAYWDGLGI